MLLSYSWVEQNGPETISSAGHHKKQHVLAMRNVVFFHIPLLVLSIPASFWGEKDNFGGKQCAHAHKHGHFLSPKKSRNIANSPLAQNSTALAGVQLS